jgi:hypothetical protein
MCQHWKHLKFAGYLRMRGTYRTWNGFNAKQPTLTKSYVELEDINSNESMLDTLKI